MHSLHYILVGFFLSSELRKSKEHVICFLHKSIWTEQKQDNFNKCSYSERKYEDYYSWQWSIVPYPWLEHAFCYFQFYFSGKAFSLVFFRSCDLIFVCLLSASFKVSIDEQDTLQLSNFFWYSLPDINQTRFLQSIFRFCLNRFNKAKQLHL